MVRQGSSYNKKRTAGLAANLAAGDVPMAVAKWTVMVLMGANNIDGEEDLTKYAESDLKEMEAVGSRPNVLNILVQIDQKDADGGPKRYIISKGSRQEPSDPDELLPPGEGGSGDENVLRNFLTWAKRYSADHYLLVLWGHAYRLAFNRDPSDPDGLDFRKLSEALRDTSDLDQVIDLEKTDVKKIDIVAFDSCNVSLLEGAYQLRNTAQFMVSSQFTDPLPGWPYTEILKPIVRDPEIGAQDFGRAIVSQFVRHYSEPDDQKGRDNVTMTLLDLGEMDDIGSKFGDLAIQLLLSVNEDQSELDRVKDFFQLTQVVGNQPSVDLISFCWQLQNHSGHNKLRVAAAALGNLLVRSPAPFIVAHERSGLVVAMLQGVSVFAPNVKPGFDASLLRERYSEWDLAQDTLWGDLVFALAEPDA
jgi:hypothetical protein